MGGQPTRGGGGQPFSGRNSLTDHKKTSDVPLDLQPYAACSGKWVGDLELTDQVDNLQKKLHQVTMYTHSNLYIPL